MKKTCYLIILFFNSLVAFGQDTIDIHTNQKICDCIHSLKNPTEESSAACFSDLILKDSVFLTIVSKLEDKSEQAGNELGRRLFENVSLELIGSCNDWYILMENLRVSDFKTLNVDSIKKEIVKIDSVDISKRTSNFYTFRGVMYFQTSELNKAIADFDMALNLNKNEIQSIFFKAWSLEIKGEYDNAILLYNQLVLLTNNPQFKIFEAIAKRKKHGI